MGRRVIRWALYLLVASEGTGFFSLVDVEKTMMMMMGIVFGVVC